MDLLRTDIDSFLRENKPRKNFFQGGVSHFVRELLGAWLAGGLLLFSAGSLLAGGPGTGSANFLRIPVGARETAMGGAFTAAANNSGAVYYNPAGLNLLESREVTFTQNKFVEGVSQQWLAGAYPYKSGVLGLGVNYLSVSPFAAYDKDDNRTGSVSADNLAVYFSWGGGLPFEYKYARAISYGATVKIISETLAAERGSGYGLDLGVQADSPVENLRFGLAIENAASSRIKFIDKGARPPLTLKTGVTYAVRSAVGPVVRGSLDCVFRGDSAGYLAAGLESQFSDMLSLRMGYSALDDISNGLNFGVGMLLSNYTRRNITVDYSFSPTYSFGDIHKLSVTYKFGPRRATPASIAADKVSVDMNIEPPRLPPALTPSEYYLDVFNKGTLPARRIAINELGERGGEDSLKLLIAILKDSNPFVIRDAVSVLSRFNDQRVIAPFIELLKSENDFIRLAAISGLTRYKEPGVLEAIAGSLDDKSPEVRSWAAEVMGNWGGPAANGFLQAAMKKETEEKVRTSIAASLRKLDPSYTGKENDR